MGCVHCELGTSKCELFGRDFDFNPSRADENGYCLSFSECDSYEDADDDDEVCDYCGEPLGFCAEDCETREEDFEE